MQSVSFTWIVWLAFLIFSFLARTANKVCRISVALSFNVFYL